MGVDVSRCVYSVLVAGDREPIRGVPREDIRRPLKRGALAGSLTRHASCNTKAAVTVTRECHTIGVPADMWHAVCRCIFCDT
jgi:hypothetical protein